MALPFQTVETVNESTLDRRRTLDLFARGRPTEWRDRLINFGLPVVAHGFDGKDAEGIAIEVYEDGALIIEQADGNRVRVNAGDVTLATLPEPF